MDIFIQHAHLVDTKEIFQYSVYRKNYYLRKRKDCSNSIIMTNRYNHWCKKAIEYKDTFKQCHKRNSWRTMTFSLYLDCSNKKLYTFHFLKLPFLPQQKGHILDFEVRT